MADRRLLYGGGGSNMSSVFFQNQRGPSSSSSSSSEPRDSLFIPGSSSSFLGPRSMVSFEDVNGRNRSKRSFFCSFEQEENGEEDLDEYFHHPEKKRRLTTDQVRFLEKSFEVENKLEPERKIQLAKDLGLQPRQIAIWFQNRRARWKTKHLEKENESLQASYSSLRADYDSLVKEKEKLKAEVLHLTEMLLLKEKEKANLELSDTTKLSEAYPKEPIGDLISEDEVSKVSVVACKQEDSSAKSDVFDSDSPHYTDGVHSSVLEPCDSSYIFEPDQSDISQEEEDKLNNSLLPPPAYEFLKIDGAHYFDPSSNSCDFGFPVEDQAFNNFWTY
ncbi:unnamed protein product [Ilex paraguariensis]|uniref:Homeobox-leucine zipper protein n=1 Tax=Ilex paraguariensis TaxID=185542 RepID=A0ABC8UQM9_9AQUA